MGSLRGSQVHGLQRMVANVYKEAVQFQFREPGCTLPDSGGGGVGGVDCEKRAMLRENVNNRDEGGSTGRSGGGGGDDGLMGSGQEETREMSECVT